MNRIAATTFAVLLAAPIGATASTQHANAGVRLRSPTATAGTFTFNRPHIVTPGGIVEGPDGNLWFTNRAQTNGAAGSIGRMNHAGVVTNFAGHGITDPTSIAVGPDHALWFLDRSDGSVGRITIHGKVKVFRGLTFTAPRDPVAANGALWFLSGSSSTSLERFSPSGRLKTLGNHQLAGITAIARGPHHSLWFIAGRNRIGTVTSAGRVSSFTSPRIADPNAIVEGPGGAMWFLNRHHRTTPSRAYGHGSLARVSPHHKITIYSGTTNEPIRGGSNLTRGPHRTLWFFDPVEPYRRDLIRATTRGAMKPFTSDDSDAASGMTRGPLGRMWFTTGTNGIASVTSRGVIALHTSGIAFPTSLAVGPDHAVWFTNSGDRSIGRITTGGVTTEFGGAPKRLDIFSERYLPTSIVAGPDGAMWFVDRGGAGIGRITTSGHRTVLGGLDGMFGAITPGPDGALWFTDLAGGGSIGRITTTGKVTDFPAVQLGPADYSVASPSSIVAGPDGALWYTNYGFIGRITTAGVMTRFGVGGAVSLPDSITVGPDGALWFINTGNNTIGRITTAGVITSFSSPGIQHPVALATGPDGDLWFTNPIAAGDSSIGRMTTSGQVTTYHDPRLSNPGAIVTGPDNRMWFTDTDAIGQITVG